ncbi:hypothetical protein ACFL54_03000 [Planctomycetota bacterium]
MFRIGWSRLSVLTKMKIFAGNFPNDIDTMRVRTLFETHGQLQSVELYPVSMGTASPRFIIKMDYDNGIAAIAELLMDS